VITHLEFRRSSSATQGAAGNFIVIRHELGGAVFHSRSMHLQGDSSVGKR